MNNEQLKYQMKPPGITKSIKYIKYLSLGIADNLFLKQNFIPIPQRNPVKVKS